MIKEILLPQEIILTPLWQELLKGFILLDIFAVNRVYAERLRLEDGTPYLKFERGPASVVMATLEVTSDF